MLADWSVLGLFNQYRMFLLAAFAALYYLSDTQRTLGQRNAELFEIAHLTYVVFGLGCIYCHRLQRPALETQFYLQSYLDIVALGLLMYASGGVQSGLGALLLIHIALLSQLTSLRHALLFAAIATTVVLSEELFAQFLFGPWAADFERTAMLGALLFLVSWLLSVPLPRLLQREKRSRISKQPSADVKQLATLNDEIIRELDSGVLVVDSGNQVQLINDTARALLSAEFTPLPIHMNRLSDVLFSSMQQSKQQPASGTQAITITATGQDVLPQFISLSSGGMLVKLDDHTHLRKQFQQLKMASLGRLSASIAHEIRNPLGAISHAVQLLQESDTLNAQDGELLAIARKHTLRINRIVEDVLQLSNGQQVRTQPLNLAEQLNQFCSRFSDENGLTESRLHCVAEPDTYALFDPEHLDQVLWNLCTNAFLHNEGSNISITISCWQANKGIVIIDLTDDGQGIADIDREHLFEPFFSTHHEGSGLGLFIIRELCELNKAQIECVDRAKGAHFRLTLSSTQAMAA